MEQRRWRVGELAAATGLTVRTLHHFDEIGLLRPAERTGAGHRLYDDRDVRRLYRILVLRELGVPLGVIARSLAGDPAGIESAVRGQLDQVERQIVRLPGLRRRLAALLRTAPAGAAPPIDELIEAMEAMMRSRYFTPDQLARLKERHREVGGDAFGRWRRRWTALSEEALAQVEAGTDPADPAAQDLGRRWTELMDEMTGGDRHILSSMYAKLDGQGAAAATLGAVSGEAWGHVKRVLAVGFDAR